MKHRMFFKTLKKLAALCATALLLASCSDIETERDEFVPATGSGDTVRVRIAVADEARSAYPSITREAFDAFRLEFDGKVIEMWSKDAETGKTAYQMMSADTVELPADGAEHTLVLTGAVFDAITGKEIGIYKGEVTQKVKDGDTLSFALSVASIKSPLAQGTGFQGYIHFEISYPKDNVGKINYGLYYSDDGKTYDTNRYAFLNSPSTITGSFSDGYTSLIGGMYVFVVEFYSANGALLGTWEDTVGILPGKYTYIDKTIDTLNTAYNIVYHLNGGMVNDKSTYIQDYSTLVDVELAVPTKEGVDFAGWYETEDFTGTAATGWKKRTRIGGLDLYAKWNCTLTFDGNGTEAVPAEGSMNSITTVEKVPVTLSKNAFTREGYIFTGWNTVASPDEDNPGTIYEDGCAFVPEKNVTLYAQWKERTAQTHAVIFIANGGSLVDMQQVADGDKINDKQTKTEYTGYEFTGWYEKEDLTGEAFSFDTAITKDITLYAKWTPCVYKITYKEWTGKEGGAEFTGTHQTGYPTTHTFNTETELDEPTKEGCSFIGWYTSSDGGVTLDETPIAGIGKECTENLTLYTKWYQTTFHVNAESGDDTSGTGFAAKPYASFAKAIDQIAALTDDDTVFTKDLAYTVVVHGKQTCTATLDTTLDDKAASLLIMGATGNATDMLDGNEEGVVLTIKTSVPVTLQKIAVTNGNSTEKEKAGGITLRSKAQLTLEDGALITKNTGSVSGSFGGIFVWAATLNINEGAEISDNTSRDDGGAIEIRDPGAKVIMDGGKISGNKANYGGGGVKLWGSASFTMNGGEISGNTAASGAGVCNNATFYMNGGKITGNTASSYGGGVYNSGYSSSFTMTGGEISGNNVVVEAIDYYGSDVTGYGGGVSNDSNGTFSMSGGVITENSVSVSSKYYSATALGGGVCNGNSSSFTMTGGEISKNSVSATTENSSRDATAVGGAVYNLWGFHIGGGIYIPAGVGDKNDVYTSNNISIDAPLVADSTPIATISPEYEEGQNVLYGNGITLTDEVINLFKVTPAKDGSPWILVLEDRYAKLRRPVYPLVFFDKDGADFSGTLSKTDAVTHTYGSDTTLPVPKKDGSTFMGWYFDKACAGMRVETLVADEYTDTVTLYALWQKTEVTVTINNADIAVTSTEAEDGTITLTAATGYKDYTWTIGGADPATVIDGATASANTLAFSKEKLTAGRSYQITLTAKNDNGAKFMANISIKK